MTWDDGRKYVGEFKDDNRHGKGKYTWANGKIYEGGWKDGKQHGEGIFVYPDAGII